MITYCVWGSCFEEEPDEMLWLLCFMATFMSLFTIPLDIILMPIEIISLIIYKIIERRNK